MINMFARLYLAVVVTIVLGWLAADILMYRDYNQRFETATRAKARLTLLALADELAIADPILREKALQASAEPSLFTVSIEHISSYPLEPEELAELRAGRPVMWLNEVEYYPTLEVAVLDRDPNRLVWFIFGEAMGEYERSYDRNIMLAMLGAVAVVILLLTLPTVRRLRLLSETTRAFGQGEYEARAKPGGPQAVADLAKSFNRMAKQLNQAKVRQEIMTHAISHEIRTPLARLRLALDMAEGMDSAQELAAFVADMQGDVDDLEQLSDAMLSWARMNFNRQEVPMEDVDLYALAQSVLDQLQTLSPKIPIHLTTHESLICKGNAALLERALSNLVRNAQKYGATRIEIHFAMVGGKTSLCVDDNGPGIPEEKREQVFFPFAGLDQSRTKSGYGLGMAIVAHVAMAHGGDAHIETSPMGGARMIISW